jgi:hypothetical protein
VDILVHELSTYARDADGHEYRARAFGRIRRDGTWIGWLEFRPIGSGGVVRRTPRETTQPSLEALRYWALGLDEVYLEGALRRTAVPVLR